MYLPLLPQAFPDINENCRATALNTSRGEHDGREKKKDREWHGIWQGEQRALEHALNAYFLATMYLGDWV